MIQRCPVEVLDNIFERTVHPYPMLAYPLNAQSTLRRLMLTCSHFRMIAKRHFIRIVRLSKAKQIIAFAGYLKRVVESGDYGNGVLRIQHLAVVGRYRPSEVKRRSDAEFESENVIPFIISTAAPSLLSLLIFGVNRGYGIEGRVPHYNSFWHLNMGILFVPNGTIFPMLRDLIVLDQRVINLHLEEVKDGNRKFDKRACQLRYPVIRRIYYEPGDYGRSLPSALPFLADLRLNIVNSMHSPPPTQDEVSHVQSIIVDAPRYRPRMFGGFIGEREKYDSKISKYQALIDEAGSPERSEIVVPAPGFTRYTNWGLILSAWADAVVGGEGCWTTAWIPTAHVPGDIIKN